MAFKMSPIDRVEREYDVAVLLAGGAVAIPGVISFAVARIGANLTAGTTWTDCPVVGGIAKVTFIAPLAVKKAGDIPVLPGGNGVYAREVEGDLVRAVFIEQITVA